MTQTSFLYINPSSLRGWASYPVTLYQQHHHHQQLARQKDMDDVGQEIVQAVEVQKASALGANPEWTLIYINIRSSSRLQAHQRSSSQPSINSYVSGGDFVS